MNDPMTPDAFRPAALWAQPYGGRLCDLTHSAVMGIEGEPIPVGDATEMTAEDAARLWTQALMQHLMQRNRRSPQN